MHKECVNNDAMVNNIVQSIRTRLNTVFLTILILPPNYEKTYFIIIVLRNYNSLIYFALISFVPIISFLIVSSEITNISGCILFVIVNTADLRR